MPRAAFTSTDNRQIELEYDHFGNPKDPALLLIMGFTAQMVAWEEEFCYFHTLVENAIIPLALLLYLRWCC